MAHLRVTPQEVGALTARFGSVGKGLRALLDQWHTEEPGRKRGGVIPAGKGRLVIPEEITPMDPGRREEFVQQLADALDMPVEVLGPQVIEGAMDYNAPKVTPPPAPAHRHRRGALIRVDYDFGTPKNVYSCSECGQELA